MAQLRAAIAKRILSVYSKYEKKNDQLPWAEGKIFLNLLLLGGSQIYAGVSVLGPSLL